jgi:cyclic pyranopterin phosphate synthase
MQNDANYAAVGFAPTTSRADSTAPDGALIDRYGRRITYLRLSVTDRCDFRCTYCMPMEMAFLPRAQVLSLEECLAVARVFASLGADKIRLTGGEPLVRRGLAWLAGEIKKIPGINEVALTTNGSQLPRYAGELASAGVRRVNVSLDTLDAERFRAITRTGELGKVIKGIDAARRAGMKVKINTVMMRGVNDEELTALTAFAVDREIDISFIEEMPLGDIGHARAATFLDADTAMARLRAAYTLTKSAHNSGGPARYWAIAGTASKVGFISPHTHNFCESCNRVRVTCTGELYPCLGQNEAIDIKPALRGEAAGDAALRALLIAAMDIKPKGHDFNIFAPDAKVVRFMSATGG